MTINWHCTSEELNLIKQIAERVVLLFRMGSQIDIQMDIAACHLNGNPLDLHGLLNANNGDFAHDVSGIFEHLDRETGKLMHYFVPRFSRR